MTMYQRGVGAFEQPFRRGRRIYDVGALGRWGHPVLWALGALVLIGYLMIGHPASRVATPPASAPVAQVRQLTPSSESAGSSFGSISQDQSIRSSMIDVLNAALGTALAAGWLVAGAWVGIRSARISAARDEAEHERSGARHLRNDLTSGPQGAPIAVRQNRSIA